jgi:two-component system cell cycle sensor histidine kinase/response regulator CckA
VRHIFIVDDEPGIRGLAARVLERKGYGVQAFATPADALAATGPIDLLLVDLILPDMNGRALAEKLRERHPDLPVVLMSGYLPQPDLTPPPPSSFLQKPMTMSDVLKVVAEMIGEPSA